MVATYFRTGRGRSRRAECAEQDGLLPLSRIGTGRAVRAAAMILGRAEWHHTGKFARATDYYDSRAVRSLAAELTRDGIDRGVARITARRTERARRDAEPLDAISQLYAVRREIARVAQQVARLAADDGGRRDDWIRVLSACRAQHRRLLIARYGVQS